MFELKLYGRGGQGVVTAAKVLVSAAVLGESFAQAIPAYGQERQGAPVYACARVSHSPIEINCFVYEPDCAVVFDINIKELGVDFEHGLKSGGIIIANTQKSLEELGVTTPVSKYGAVDAWTITDKILGRVPPNAAMLGALARTTEWVKIEHICQALMESMPGRKGVLNADAARAAYEQTRVITF